MADNTTLTAGAGGDVIATDDIGPGVKYQRVKITLGADGVTDGDVSSTNKMPVADSVVAGHLDGVEGLLGTIDADTSALAGAVYTEDAAAAADPTGGVVMLVREDARAGTLTTTDGDNVALRGNNKGEAYVLDTDGNAILTTIDAVLDLVNAKLVTGTVIGDVNLGAVDNAVLDAIAASLVTIDADTSALFGTVAGTEVQVDVVAALPAGTNAIGKLAANTGVDIGDVDVTSVVPGTGATNLGKAIDGASGATDTGVAALAIRDDTLGALTPIEGDYVPLRVNSTGALHVTGGGGGTEYTLGTDTYTEATSVGAIAAVVRSDAGGSLVNTDNEVTALQVDSAGALRVTGGGGGTEYTEDAAAAANPVGTTLILVREDARAGSLTTTDGDNVALRGNNKGEAYVLDTDGNALLTTIDADTGAIKTAVELLDNAVSGAGFNITQLNGAAVPIGAGTEAAAVRVTLATDSTGVVSIDDNAGSLTVDGSVTANAGTNLNTSALALETGGNLASAVTALQIMDDWDNAASDGASVSGDVAHDTADAGEPVKIGAKAYSPDGTTPGTAVAEADRTDLKSDLDGRLFVNTASPRRAHKHLDGSAAYTDEAIAASPGAGFQTIITSIIVSTGAATAMNFFLEEATTKIFGPIYLEAVAGRGFVSGPIHLPITAATAVTITTSAAIAQAVDVDYFTQAV